MVLDQVVTIGGEGGSEAQDVSDFIESIRVDEHMTFNESDRIEIVLINVNGMFTGAFKTNDPMEGSVINRLTKCLQVKPVEMKIFTGQVQKVSYNPKKVSIVGSCRMGTLTDFVARDYDSKKKKISQVVNDLLDMHDAQPGNLPFSERVIDITADSAFDHQWPVFKSSQVSYQTAITFLANRCGAIWYTDEEGVFYFVDPKAIKGAYDLDPWMLNPDETLSVVGHVNILKVIGSGVYPPSSDFSYIESHKRFYAEARNDDSISRNGELVGPTLISPNLSSQAMADARAENLKEFFRLTENVAKPQLAGFVPPLLSFVKYHAGVFTSARCANTDPVGTVQPALVDGIVTRRVIEYSARGLIAELEVATSVPESGVSYIDPLADAVIDIRDDGTDPDEADEAFIDALDGMTDDEVKRATEEIEDRVSTDTDEPEEEDEPIPTLEDGVEITIGSQTFTLMPVTEGGKDYLLAPPNVVLSLFDMALENRPNTEYEVVTNGDRQLIYNIETGRADVSKSGRQGYHQVIPWNQPDSLSVTKNLAGGWPDYV